MIHSRFLPAKWFRILAVAVVVYFTLLSASALPCPRERSQQDRWIQQKVPALVRSARSAYETDGAQRRYHQVVKQIAGEINRCAFRDDRDFVNRYPEFFEYMRLLALALTDDHELGFEVTDKEYFSATSAFTAIPDFLLTPRFLRAVSRFENLPQAKTLLRQMNATRASDDQLLFMSYASRHLGTPDNPDSYP